KCKHGIGCRNAVSVPTNVTSLFRTQPASAFCILNFASSEWARQDSNLGPTDYEPAALTAELRAPKQIPNPKSQAPNPKLEIPTHSFDLGFGIWVLGFTKEHVYVRPSKKAFSLRERDGCRSLRSAFASIWRMRSRVTAKFCPTSSSVCSLPSPTPNRILITFSSRGVSVFSTDSVCSLRFKLMTASAGETMLRSSMKSPRCESSSSP